MRARARARAPSNRKTCGTLADGPARARPSFLAHRRDSFSICCIAVQCKTSTDTSGPYPPPTLPTAYFTYSLPYRPPLPSPPPPPPPPSPPQPFLFKPSPASLGLWKVEGARPSSARALRARRLQQGHDRRGVGGLTELRQGVHCGGLRGRVACKRKKQKASECAVAVRARR